MDLDIFFAFNWIFFFALFVRCGAKQFCCDHCRLSLNGLRPNNQIIAGRLYPWVIHVIFYVILSYNNNIADAVRFHVKLLFCALSEASIHTNKHICKHTHTHMLAINLLIYEKFAFCLKLYYKNTNIIYVKQAYTHTHAAHLSHGCACVCMSVQGCEY